MTSPIAPVVKRTIAVLVLLGIPPAVRADFGTDQTWSFTNPPNPITNPFPPESSSNPFTSNTNPLNAQLTGSGFGFFQNNMAVLQEGAGIVFRVPDGNSPNMPKMLTLVVLYQFVSSTTARLDTPAVTDNSGNAFTAGSSSDTSSGNGLRRFQGNWTDPVCPLNKTVTITNSNAFALLELISVEISTTCATPEPASLVSAGFGAVALGAFGWRRRRPSRN